MGYHETVLGVEISAMRNDAGIADPPPVLTLSDFAEPHFGDRAIFQHENQVSGPPETMVITSSMPRPESARSACSRPNFRIRKAKVSSSSAFMS